MKNFAFFAPGTIREMRIAAEIRKMENFSLFVTIQPSV